MSCLKQNTFTRYQRLNIKDFKKFFINPYRLSSKNLLILWKPGNDSCGKIGIITKKKIIPHAVIRNQIKRIIKESYRLANQTLKKINIIVIIRQPYFHPLNKLDLRKEIDTLWEKLIKHFHSHSFT